MLIANHNRGLALQMQNIFPLCCTPRWYLSSFHTFFIWSLYKDISTVCMWDCYSMSSDSFCFATVIISIVAKQCYKYPCGNTCLSHKDHGPCSPKLRDMCMCLLARIKTRHKGSWCCQIKVGREVYLISFQAKLGSQGYWISLENTRFPHAFKMFLLALDGGWVINNNIFNNSVIHCGL